MSKKHFIFTVKSMRNYSYLYLQKAIFKRGKRKVLSYSLGPLDKLNEILTRILSTADSLFLGEYLTYCFADKVGLNQALTRELRKSGASARQIRLLQCLISLRAIRPFSKAKLSRFWDHSFLQTLQQVSHVNELYQAMAVVKNPQALFPRLVQQVLRALGHTYETIYYDTTTVFFYSDCDSLRRKGYSKEGKRGAPLVKLAVSCTEEYLPLTYQVFPGNRADITCFQAYLDVAGDPSKLLVFDAGCYSFPLVTTLETQGYRYITSCDIRTQDSVTEYRAVQVHGQKWLLREAVYRKHRVIEAYNEETRARGVVKLAEKIQRVQEFAREVAGRNGESKRDKVRDLIKGLGLGSILTVELTGDEVRLMVNEERWKQREEATKVVVLMTNLEAEGVEIVRQYLRRDEVERVIRYLKTPLAIRPVFHANPQMIQRHFFLTMLGFLEITALRIFLQETQGLRLSLEQVMEDLSFATVTTLEPKAGLFLTYAGRQVEWINRLLQDWDLPISHQPPPLGLSSQMSPP